MTFSLDTGVVVAATVGRADRLWDKWAKFRSTITDPCFVSNAAYEQFELVVEGLGTGEPGVFDQAISDTMDAIRRSGNRIPDHALIVQSLRNPNRVRRVEGIVSEIRRKLGEQPWGPVVARNVLRRYEAAFAMRRAEFFKTHPVLAPQNNDDTQSVFEKLWAIHRKGGDGWTQACRIVAQSAVIGRERRFQVTLVAEGGHIFGRGAAMGPVAGLHGIVDLSFSNPP